jgi:hypothetical protein
MASALVAELRLPAAAKTSRHEDRRGIPTKDPGAQAVIEACIGWLGMAQDCSTTQDGGVARHFSLINGWSSSYPETTGYIVATLIAHANRTGNRQSLERARRMLDWLLAIQYPEGGFQGGMVDQTPRVPVTFNTGQILIGLSAGAGIDARYREAMTKAADWLVSTQDPDGCWRRNPTPFAEPGEKTYETHVSLGLFDAHAVEPSRGYLAAGLRQVDWALKNQAPNGWLAKCCLGDPLRPLTHTLGYALRGIVGAYLSTRDKRYLDAATRTADGLLRAHGSDGRLPGRLDAQWQAAVDWACLTGMSQIAECWLLLDKETGRDDYRRAAERTNSYVRRTVLVEGRPEIRGGVKGSFPVDGEYGRWQYLNWAAKFTVDANVAELEAGAKR